MRGLETAKFIHAFATPEEIQWISEILRVIGREPPVNWVTTTFPPQQAPLVVNVTVTSAYFRAVAKIAFHYTLKMFPDLTSIESEFIAIKDFIWMGGDTTRFVHERHDQFMETFRRGYRPTRWMHILAVERAHTGITAHVQLFAGPQMLSLPYQVHIGANPSRVISRRQHRAHKFVILNPSASHSHRGCFLPPTKDHISSSSASFTF